MARTNKKVAWALVVLAVIPILLQICLSKKNKSYDQLIYRYECYPVACEADFNSDGQLEQVERVRRSLTSIDELLVVKDKDYELLSIPYEYVDGSLRTHVAIRTETGNSTLLVFDGTRGGEPQRKAFRWNGRQLVEVTPSPADLRILTALAARDNAGTWVFWGLYTAFMMPLLLGYYALLVLIVGLLIGSRWLRGRRRRAA
jgi:hypothetical protein